MNTAPVASGAQTVRSPLARIAVATLVCGIAGAIGMGTAGAASHDDTVPAVSIKFDPRELSTERGARQVYRRLVQAAQQVCPADISTGTLLPAKAGAECRAQALARAVAEINNANLAAVYSASSKRG
jgi:UrcA family protein